MKQYYEAYTGEKCKYKTYQARIKHKYMSYEEAIKPTSKLTEQIRAINPNISLSTVKNRLNRWRDLQRACTEKILPPSWKWIRKYKEYDPESWIEYGVYVRRMINGRWHERSITQPKKILRKS